MTRLAQSSRADQVLGKVLTGVDRAVRRMLLSDYGIRGILDWLKVRAAPHADTLSAADPSGDATHTARAQGAGSALRRFSSGEANDGRVA